MIKLKTRDLKLIKKALMDAQGGICVICKREFSTMPISDVVVDHDHSTGVIRGALCRRCNGAEGRVKTRAILASNGKTYATWLLNLAYYLRGDTACEPKYLHPTHKTEREKMDAKNKKARSKYKKDRMAALKRKRTTSPKRSARPSTTRNVTLKKVNVKKT